MPGAIMFLRTVTSRFLPAFGMTALVLGHVALLLFFMPILGIPLAAIGLLFGLLGILLALVSRSSSLRWSLAGVAACGLALAVNAAISYAPETESLPGRGMQQQWQPTPVRPMVPPPARAG
jgi:hypothetical protein